MEQKTFEMNHQPFNSSLNLKDLQERFPLIGDRAILDLVNGIDVNRDIISFKKNRGFFGRLIDRVDLDSSDSKRQMLLNGNLVEGQSALCDWILELSNILNISQVGLITTQRSLLEARDAIRKINRKVREQNQSIESLTDRLDSLNQKFRVDIEHIYEIISRQERRITRLEAREQVHNAIFKWNNGTTYFNLPWLIQVVMLSQEIFSSAKVLEYDLYSKKDSYELRSDITERIIYELKHKEQIPANTTFFTSLDKLVDDTCSNINSEDFDIIAAILVENSHSGHESSPYLFTLNQTLELANLPPDVVPKQPGFIACALSRSKMFPRLPFQVDSREIVDAIICETANRFTSLWIQAE